MVIVLEEEEEATELTMTVDKVLEKEKTTELTMAVD